jgi:hypothetical protein
MRCGAHRAYRGGARWHVSCGEIGYRAVGGRRRRRDAGSTSWARERIAMVSTQSTGAGTDRWDLTAPESWVLLNGPKADSQPFKLGLTELMARGALRLIESKGRFGKKTVLLADGLRASAPNEAALRALWELYRRGSTKTTPDGTGVPVDQLARSAKSTFGSVGGYVHRAVLPGLVERGLFEKKEGRFLFVFPKTSYELTPSGQAKRSELEGVIARGKESFAGWVNDDPARAVAFVGAAGAAVLLAPALFPDMRRLHQSGVESGYVSDSDFSSADFDFDLGAFDSLDSAFDAIDSGVDAGDGGSDGGGGDGGGGD